MDKFSVILNEHNNEVVTRVQPYVLYQSANIIDINDESTLIIEENDIYVRTLTINEIIKSQNLDRDKINEIIMKLFRQFVAKIKAKYVICNDLDYATFSIACFDHFDRTRIYDEPMIDNAQIIIMDTQFMYFFTNKNEFEKMIKGRLK